MYDIDYSYIILLEIFISMLAYLSFIIPSNAIYYKDIHKDESGNIIKTKYSIGESSIY
jgi:hypothetical protein